MYLKITVETIPAATYDGIMHQMLYTLNSLDQMRYTGRLFNKWSKVMYAYAYFVYLNFYFINNMNHIFDITSKKIPKQSESKKEMKEDTMV